MGRAAGVRGSGQGKGGKEHVTSTLSYPQPWPFNRGCWVKGSGPSDPRSHLLADVSVPDAPFFPSPAPRTLALPPTRFPFLHHLTPHAVTPSR